MFDKKGGHKISLKWKSQICKSVNDRLSKIIYENTKADNKDLRKFITEERAKNANILLDFIINGTNLGFWLNLNYYTSKVIGERYQNTITWIFNNQEYESINFCYEKIILKRILGQIVDMSDCMDYAKSFGTIDEKGLKEYANQTIREENRDTMLYCSGCCGDRACGYFGIQVFQTKTSIIWHIGLYGDVTKFEFKKENYFSEFKEYNDLVNLELQNKGIKGINLGDEGRNLLTTKEKVASLKEKFLIDDNNFSNVKLKKIFKRGEIEDVDTAIHLAKILGLNLEQLKKEIEEEYMELSSKEKSSISWKIHDLKSYFDSSNLHFKALSFKAYLLYNEKEN